MTPAGATFRGLHSYDYFKMIPKSKITFNPPATKTAGLSIPYVDGIIDTTELLTNKIAYSNRQGSIEFVILHNLADYPTVYSKCMRELHGKTMRIVLDDDPLFYYQGRIFVNAWKSMEGASTIVLDYDLDPYKYAVRSTEDYDWLWNDLFNTIIYYGTFDVSGSKRRNLINPSSQAVLPKFTCSSKMTVQFGGVKYTLPKGTSSNYGFMLNSGDNYMTFTGNGRVSVDYSMDKQL